MESLLHRFLRYIAVDTQSDELSESQPSTGKQLRLLEMLRDELKSMGVEAELDTMETDDSSTAELCSTTLVSSSPPPNRTVASTAQRSKAAPARIL